jgi:hypothetical protein
MPAVEPVPPLERSIRATLAAGIELTETVCRFMEATFGDASPAALQALLDDDSNTERDSLLDLLYFPDHALQTAIEPILQRDPPTAVDVARLADRFKAEPAVARFLFPGSDVSIEAALPAFGVDGFFRRLNLTWQTAAALEAALSRVDARPLSPKGELQDGRNRLRVWLRNAALGQTPAQVRFLCDFMARRPIDEASFVDQLRFSLVFLQEHEDATNLYTALMNRKKFIFRHLLKARQAAERSAGSNMETLMMTGVRTPHFDVGQGEQILVLIDRIAMAVFGCTEQLEGALREVDLGAHTDGVDPLELIRRLS